MLFITPDNNSVDFCSTYMLVKKYAYRTGSFYQGGKVAFGSTADARGWTYALDAATLEVRWKRRATGPMIAGITPTAGGVVFTGETRGDFIALSADTGAVLYHFSTGGAIAGGVSTYAVGGKQYVAVASGNSSRTLWGNTGSATLVLFSLQRYRHPPATQSCCAGEATRHAGRIEWRQSRVRCRRRLVQGGV